ncbi:MFS transporter [Streptomyces katsurahamanus]|uniref:MFS transporter n=1 Tax=Streptomyces katsurahamanus TaxID=2577098 RepID=A0ABW9NNA5_9ACTN|nr:MFS transporter [Streptomyces katsurahamanus]MQS34792.1 MFS transporter [Streptomyces katsurahamanus]
MSSPSYSAVLRTRHAPGAFGAALLGRLSYGMVALSLMLAVTDATGSYSVAGVVMALFGAASVLLSPARAALIDRYGPRRALPPMALAYALALAALAHATWRPGASGLWLGALAVAAGACTPPLGPVMRTLWSALIPDRALLQRAYSLDGVAEELLFVTGPMLVGLLVTFSVPAAGVAVSAGLVLAGALALAFSPAAPVRRSRMLLRRAAGLRHAVLAMAALGLSLGALDLLVVAFAERHGQGAAAAWALAALSAGGAVGGLAYGAVTWRSSGRTRLAALLAALGVALTAAGLAPDVRVLVAFAGVAGLFVAPAITTAYLLADESVEPGSRTQAGAWANTAFNAGTSVGMAAVGLLVDRLPAAVCFAVAALPALLAAGVIAHRARTLRPAQRRASAQAPLERT